MLFLCFIAGCSFPTITLPEDYRMAQSESVGLYVLPCGDIGIDQVYPNLLYLDLSAKGYNVTNINMIPDIRNVTLPWSNHSAIFDTLLKQQCMSKLRTVFIVHLHKDSAKVFTDLQESYVADGKNISYRIYTMSAIQGEYVGFDVPTKKIIFSKAVTDTSILYSRLEEFRFEEYPWMLAARQVFKAMAEIPICTIENTSIARQKYEIDLYVDKSYRNQFPDDWLKRLKLRMLYVNDIFKKQFDVEFTSFRFFKWDSEFEYSLDETLKKFHQALPEQSKVIRLAITYNSQLKMNWTDRNKLGVAELLGNDCIITAQPSFPYVVGWNAVEETLTLAHELGHIFGAVHCQDKMSIMYPEAGALSYQFDSVSAEIINHTKVNFFQSGGQERIHNYMNAISNMRKTSFKNSCEVLRPVCSILAKDYFHSIIPDSLKLKKALNTLTSDMALQLGIRGFYVYKEGQLNSAVQLFERALQYQPDYAEVHWYLNKILLKEGKKAEAEEHLKLSRKYGMPRIEDDDL
jgi:tetratricopeptide (TPR) repeat protein